MRYWLFVVHRFRNIDRVVDSLVFSKFSHRRRWLLAVSYFRRLLRWEFWPWWVLYLPLWMYGLFYLAIRYRGLTVFTATNPTIPGGGIVGESKVTILDDFEKDRSFVARYTLISRNIPLHHRLEKVKEFCDQQPEMEQPVVMKSNRGHHGQGVQLIHDMFEAEQYLIDQSREDIILQEYVDGPEFGIFYMRYPNDKKGFIFSIGERMQDKITGDGVSTIESLILRDPRANCNAAEFLDIHHSQLQTVLSAGQVFYLGEFGQLVGGTMRARYDLITPMLENRIDTISQNAGFFVGRYDIRTPDPEAMGAGNNFKILEFNGVLAQSTHIYAPNRTIFQAWRDLARQWKHAYAIGYQNRLKGHPTKSLGECFAMVAESNKLLPQEENFLEKML